MAWLIPLLCCVLASITFGTDPKGAKCVCQDGMSYEGNDIKTLPVADDGQCCGLCQTTPGCHMGVVTKNPKTGAKMCKMTGGKVDNYHT